MTEFSHCPDCSAPLGKERSKCRCGWAMPKAAQIITDPNHIPCAADRVCRRPGRMWIEPYPSSARVCIFHYYDAIERERAA